jgi:hypothetical protein
MLWCRRGQDSMAAVFYPARRHAGVTCGLLYWLRMELSATNYCPHSGDDHIRAFPGDEPMPLRSGIQ